MSAQDALQAIYDEHGTLTPDLVVTLAADPDHELHPRFEWDDSEAARRYRLVQASGLIRSVTVNIDRGEDRGPVRVRAFVADHELGVGPAPDADEPATVGAYRPVQEVITSDVLRTAWFRALARDWQALKRRAGQSKEFADMVLADVHSLAG